MSENAQITSAALALMALLCAAVALYCFDQGFAVAPLRLCAAAALFGAAALRPDVLIHKAPTRLRYALGLAGLLSALALLYALRVTHPVGFFRMF